MELLPQRTGPSGFVLRAQAAGESRLLAALHLFSGLGQPTKSLTTVAVCADGFPVAGLWESKTPDGWAFDIAVSPAFQNQGIGTELAKLALSHAQENNARPNPNIATLGGKRIVEKAVQAQTRAL